MKVTVISTIAAIALSAAGLAAQAKPDSPFYCDLTRLTPADRAHKDEIGRRLASVRIGVRELADGYEFQFPGDDTTLKQVYEWVVTERLCCPFFDIDVRAGREDGPVAIRLTGRKGTKDFIKTDFGRWMK